MKYLARSETKHKDAIVHLVNKLWVNKGDFSYYKYFEFWEQNGFHITPNQFYQPIPDTRNLTSKVFKKIYSLENTNFSPKKQAVLLDEFAKYDSELKMIPDGPQKDYNGFHFNNMAFDGLDANVYYSMIRHFKPKRITEVGSGWSTKIASLAVGANKEEVEFVSIEPYPLYFMSSIPNLTRLIKKKVENVDLSELRKLGKNDILFIDTSHVIRTGGDVNYLMLDVLPELNAGVIVHIHDIFMPYEYPADWVKKEHRFWTEQYLVLAFLIFNNSFDVLISNSFLTGKEQKLVKSTFKSKDRPWGGASLWIRKFK
jgi:hypothetical protein